MKRRIAPAGILPAIVVLLLCGASDVVRVPNSWADPDIAAFRLPLAAWSKAPRMLSERDYYALPESNVKTYPAYTPDKEPANYLDWLRQQEPEPLVDVASLKTE